MDHSSSNPGFTGPSDSRDADFLDLLAPLQAKLFGYIFALVPHTEDAHDLYQQTVMVLWQKFEQFEADTNFKAWALKAAQLEVLAYRRRKGRSRLLFCDELMQQLIETQTDASQTDRSETRAEFLKECMKSLSAVDRTLVEKCYLGSMRIQQVAAALGRSPQSICNSLRRIRTALLSCVDFKWAEDGRQ
jgi:RNA polymerase sigma-70 factor (ECF subfamily)